MYPKNPLVIAHNDEIQGNLPHNGAYQAENLRTYLIAVVKHLSHMTTTHGECLDHVEDGLIKTRVEVTTLDQGVTPLKQVCKALLSTHRRDAVQPCSSKAKPGRNEEEGRKRVDKRVIVII